MLRTFLILGLITALSANFGLGHDPLIRELSEDGHLKIEVKVETTVEQDGDLFVVTTRISGKMLKRKLGVMEVAREEIVERPPPETTRTCEIEILDPDLVIGQDHEVPRWTYEVYGNPAMSMPVYVKADPINLVIDAPFCFFDYQMRLSGWTTSESWNLLKANVNYVPLNGKMVPQCKNYYLDNGNGSRYHLRLWRHGDVLIGQAHMDEGIPHEACKYENSECSVVKAFSLHITRRNCIWLANKCTDNKGYRNNGWASYIKTYKQYN